MTGTQDMAMPYRRLGCSNLQVSALCLGTMMFGDQTGREGAAGILADARAQGVNFIDTADVYTKGASEVTLGELLQGQRHDWVLATKLGNAMSQRVNEGHYSRSWMQREVEASLRRLQTDYVDLYQLHWPDRNQPMFGDWRFDPDKERPTVPILAQLEALADIVGEEVLRRGGPEGGEIVCL